MEDEVSLLTSGFQKVAISCFLGTTRVCLVCRNVQRLWDSKRRPNWNSVSHHSFSASFLLLEGSKLIYPWKGHSSLLHAAKVLSLPPAWMSPTHPPLVLAHLWGTAKSRPWQLLLGTSQPGSKAGSEALPDLTQLWRKWGQTLAGSQGWVIEKEATLVFFSLRFRQPFSF